MEDFPLKLTVVNSYDLLFGIWRIDILTSCIFLVDVQLVPRLWYLENINQIKKKHLNLQKHLNTDLNKKFSDNVIYTKTRV